MVHDDPVERLSQLRDRADSLAQKMQTAQSRVTAFTGADSTGAITVTVNAAGHVREVAVEQGWRRRIDPERLPDAVREAVRTASVARLQVWGEAFAEQDEAVDPRARAASLPGETVAAQLDEVATVKLTSGHGRLVLAELLAMAEEVERGLDQASAQIQAQLSAAFEATSDGGHVAAAVSGSGEVTGLRYDRRWLAEAHETNVGRETAQALRAAYRRAGEHSAAAIVERGPLGEIQALGQDPLGLARRLRLRDN